MNNRVIKPNSHKDMTNTTEIQHLQQASRFCYRLFTQDLGAVHVDPEDTAALSRVMGASITAEEILQVARRLRGRPDYEAFQNRLLSKWQARLDADQLLTEAEASEFLQELLGALDHAVLFNQGVTASTTTLQRGTTSSVDMQYPGNMPCWTIHMTTSGSGLLLNEEMEVQVSRGDMMLFQPDAQYHAGLHPNAEHWRHHWALFHPRAHWSEWLSWQPLDGDIMILRLPDEHSIDEIDKLFINLMGLRETPEPIQQDLLSNRLEEILIRASGYIQQSQATQKQLDTRIQQACDFMQTHLTEQFRIDDVAAACSLSPSRLAHLFKEHMGVSPKFWSNNLRLQRARQLLLSSNKSIASIAREVGYEDPTHFTRYFTQNLGCSPRAFRQSFAVRSA